MSDVLQCPYCTLRFRTRSELDQHKALDHPTEQEEEHARVEPDRPTVQSEEHAEEIDRGAEKRGFLSRLFKRS